MKQRYEPNQKISVGILVSIVLLKRLFMKLNYYRNLDGVRAIAALMVIIFHFFHELNTQDSYILVLKKMATVDQIGVTLFFVLSGFLITRILINTKETRGYFKNFYLR